jgi:hypothetical protein
MIPEALCRNLLFKSFNQNTQEEVLRIVERVRVQRDNWDDHRDSVDPQQQRNKKKAVRLLLAKCLDIAKDLIVLRIKPAKDFVDVRIEAPIDLLDDIKSMLAKVDNFAPWGYSPGSLLSFEALKIRNDLEARGIPVHLYDKDPGLELMCAIVHAATAGDAKPDDVKPRAMRKRLARRKS